MRAKINTNWLCAAGVSCLTVTAAMLAGCTNFVINPDDGTNGQDARQAPAKLIAPLRVSPQPNREASTSLELFSWTPVAGATKYELHVGPDTNPPAIVTTTETTYTIRDLPACTTHYWRVVAISDTESVSSAIWTFKTRCPR